MSKKIKKKKSKKRIIIEYAIFAAVLLILYLTGLHTEVIGFMQRGLLATGLITPKIEMTNQDDSQGDITASTTTPPADFNLMLMDEDGQTILLKILKANQYL